MVEPVPFIMRIIMFPTGMGQESEYSLIIYDNAGKSLTSHQPWLADEYIEKILRRIMSYHSAQLFGLLHERRFSRILPDHTNEVSAPERLPISWEPVFDRAFRDGRTREIARSSLPYDYDYEDFTVTAWYDRPTRREGISDDLFTGAGILIPGVGRLYREGAAPYLECATWLASDPFELARLILRGQKIAGLLAREVSNNQHLVECNNMVSDRQGTRATSCGMHENHFISRALFDRLTEPHYPSKRWFAYDLSLHRLGRAMQDFLSFKVLKILFSGAGTIGHSGGSRTACYQLSERADFIERYIGGSTTDHRPLINMRDEPHADYEAFARFHDINGEGNRSPWAMILSAGLTSMLLSAMHDDALDLDWYLATPFSTLGVISRDIACAGVVPIVNRSTHTIEYARPVDLLSKIVAKLAQYATRSGAPDWHLTLAGEAIDILHELADGIFDGKAATMLDWLIKMRFLRNSMLKKHLNPDMPDSWMHPAIRLIDRWYHRLDNTKAWDTASSSLGVRDIDSFSTAEDKLFSSPAPAYTNAYLLNMLISDPNLTPHARVSNWGVIWIRADSTDEFTGIGLNNPVKFTREYLAGALEGDFDFSTPEKRARLIQILRRDTNECDIRKIERFRLR